MIFLPTIQRIPAFKYPLPFPNKSYPISGSLSFKAKSYSNKNEKLLLSSLSNPKNKLRSLSLNIALGLLLSTGSVSHVFLLSPI